MSFVWLSHYVWECEGLQHDSDTVQQGLCKHLEELIHPIAAPTLQVSEDLDTHLMCDK